MCEHVERTRSAMVIPVVDKVETDLLQNPAAREVLHRRICPQIWRTVGIRVLGVPPHQRECQLSGQAVAPWVGPQCVPKLAVRAVSTKASSTDHRPLRGLYSPLGPATGALLIQVRGEPEVTFLARLRSPRPDEPHRQWIRVQLVQVDNVARHPCRHDQASRPRHSLPLHMKIMAAALATGRTSSMSPPR